MKHLKVLAKPIAAFACTASALAESAQCLPDYTYADSLAKDGKVTICDANVNILQSNLRAAIPLPVSRRS